MLVLSDEELRVLSRTPLPVPPRESSPWQDEAPERPGRHYAPLDKARLPARPIAAKVVGLTFVPTYPANLDDVEHEGMRGEGYGVLVREPDNPYDANSVRVDWVSMVTGEQQEIGHLPAGLAGRLAPELDGGVEWMVTSCHVLRTTGMYADRPGCSVTIVPPEQPDEGGA